MKSNIGRQLLLKEVQKEFGTQYPYLRIDFTRSKNRGNMAGSTVTTPAGDTTELSKQRTALPGDRPEPETDQTALTADLTSPGEEPYDEIQHDKAAALAARDLLYQEFELNEEMKVGELEVLLQYEFGVPAQILRKSGNLWMETRLTQHWTLREQNDHGRDIATGFSHTPS